MEIKSKVFTPLDIKVITYAWNISWILSMLVVLTLGSLEILGVKSVLVNIICTILAILVFVNIAMLLDANKFLKASETQGNFILKTYDSELKPNLLIICLLFGPLYLINHIRFDWNLNLRR